MGGKDKEKEKKKIGKYKNTTERKKRENNDVTIKTRKIKTENTKT